jgi:hypothetical protein
MRSSVSTAVPRQGSRSWSTRAADPRRRNAADTLSGIAGTKREKKEEIHNYSRQDHQRKINGYKSLTRGVSRHSLVAGSRLFDPDQKTVVMGEEGRETANKK